MKAKNLENHIGAMESEIARIRATPKAQRNRDGNLTAADEARIKALREQIRKATAWLESSEGGQI